MFRKSYYYLSYIGSVIISKLIRYKEMILHYKDLGFDQLGGRIDYRLTRLEILQYYQDSELYNKLDESQKEIIKYLRDDYLALLPRKFPVWEDVWKDEYNNLGIEIKKEGHIYYWNYEGKKIFLSTNRRKAFSNAVTLYKEFFTANPHQYVNKSEDGIDIEDGDIIVDVGAAEGLFGISNIEKVSRVYLFECDPKWLYLLKKSTKPYKDKVVIVNKLVGDGTNGTISLDKYFEDKEKPTVVKMDVEGYEPIVLKGMEGLLRDSHPLKLFVCTYHRQADYDEFSKKLGDRFRISSSNGYFWHMPDPMPPFFRHGVMRAVKKTD